MVPSRCSRKISRHRGEQAELFKQSRRVARRGGVTNGKDSKRELKSYLGVYNKTPSDSRCVMQLPGFFAPYACFDISPWFDGSNPTLELPWLVAVIMLCPNCFCSWMLMACCAPHLNTNMFFTLFLNRKFMMLPHLHVLLFTPSLISHLHVHKWMGIQGQTCYMDDVIELTCGWCNCTAFFKNMHVN